MAVFTLSANLKIQFNMANHDQTMEDFVRFFKEENAKKQRRPRTKRVTSITPVFNMKRYNQLKVELNK